MSRGRLLISGLGIAGPALAWWLAQYGFEPTIVEIAPAPRTGGYAIDFWGIGFDVAERMGLLPQLRKSALPIRQLIFVDEQGKPAGGFDVSALRSITGERFVTLPRSELARIIYDSVRDDAQFIFDDSIAEIQQDQRAVTVKFRSGKSSDFDLLIGADGLHSIVRKLVLGPESDFERYYGYCVAALIIDDYPHRTPQAYVCYTTPGKQIARFQLQDQRTGVLFVFAHPSADLPRQEAEQKRLVADTFRGVGWECPELLERIGAVDDFYFDAVSQIRMPHWSAGRVSLLGDAAFCPSLLAGQGAALAVAGAYVLAGELSAAGSDHAKAFNRYEQKFRPFVEKKQASAQGFARWLVPSSRTGIWLRNHLTNLMFLPGISHWALRRFIADDFTLENYK